MKTNYDYKSKDLPSITPNTTVRIYSKSKYGNWKRKGKVVSVRNEPRSYNVLNEKGNIIRRNRWQLLPTNETYEQDMYSDDDDYSDYDNEDEYQVDIGRNENNTEQPIINNQGNTNNIEYSTRYGRISKKPIRYGYDS